MSGPYTILFVEDDTGVRASTAELLAMRGFRLLVAENGYEAMRLLAQNDVDVLFTDIVMPELDGIALAKEAKRLKPDLKIMFMTGYYSQRLVDQLPQLHRIHSPGVAGEIEDKLHELLEPKD